MRAAHIDKLYSKLTNGELSALAFEALMRGDDDERMAIIANVDNRYYQCLNQEFTWRFNGYIDLALFYGMTYWKCRTYMNAAETIYKKDGGEKSQTLLFHFVDKVMAMECALQAVCNQANIDFMAVKKLAQCANEYSPEKCGNPELVKEYTDLFMGMIE